MTTRWKAYHFIVTKGGKTAGRDTYIRHCGILRLVVEQMPGSTDWRSMAQIKLSAGHEPHILFSDKMGSVTKAKRHATERATAIIDRTRQALGTKSRYQRILDKHPMMAGRRGGLTRARRR